MNRQKNKRNDQFRTCTVICSTENGRNACWFLRCWRVLSPASQSEDSIRTQKYPSRQFFMVGFEFRSTVTRRVYKIRGYVRASSFAATLSRYDSAYLGGKYILVPAHELLAFTSLLILVALLFPIVFRARNSFLFWRKGLTGRTRHLLWLIHWYNSSLPYWN